MDSRIEMTDEVENKSRKFGSNLTYFPCYIVTKSGEKIEALFTHDQMETAIERAQSNPEDMPEEYTGLFGWLFG